MTVVHRFLSTDLTGKRRDFKVIVYDRLGDLRGAAQRYSNNPNNAEEGISPDRYKYANGVTHTFQIDKVNADGFVLTEPDSAIIRLCRGHLSPEIVSHEITHLAMYLYGLDKTEETDLAGDHFHGGNEEFAYLLGSLFGTVWEMLRNLWLKENTETEEVEWSSEP